jgi:hypothetical protein
VTDKSNEPTTTLVPESRFRIGLCTGLACGLWLVAIITSRICGRDWDYYQAQVCHLTYLGLAFGMIHQAFWFTNSFSSSVNRLMTRMVVILVGVGLYRWSPGFYPLNRSLFSVLINLCGMAISQFILHYGFQLSRWEWRGIVLGYRRRQFTTLDLGLLTLAVAVLLGAGIRVDAPIDPLEFWSVSFGIWFGLPLIGSVLGLAISIARRDLGCLLLLVSLLISILGCAVLVYMELAQHQLDPPSVRLLVTLYGAFLLAFWLTVSIVSLAGRADARTVKVVLLR